MSNKMLDTLKNQKLQLVNENHIMSIAMRKNEKVMEEIQEQIDDLEQNKQDLFCSFTENAIWGCGTSIIESQTDAIKWIDFFYFNDMQCEDRTEEIIGLTTHPITKFAYDLINDEKFSAYLTDKIQFFRFDNGVVDLNYDVIPESIRDEIKKWKIER